MISVLNTSIEAGFIGSSFPLISPMLPPVLEPVVDGVLDGVEGAHPGVQRLLRVIARTRVVVGGDQRSQVARPGEVPAAAVHRADDLRVEDPREHPPLGDHPRHGAVARAALEVEHAARRDRRDTWSRNAAFRRPSRLGDSLAHTTADATPRMSITSTPRDPTQSGTARMAGRPRRASPLVECDERAACGSHGPASRCGCGSLSKIVTSTMAAAGIAESAHALRHTVATRRPTTRRDHPPSEGCSFHQRRPFSIGVERRLAS
jgi:hypothetical protein